MHLVHWLSDRHVQNLHSDIMSRRVWLPPCCEKLGPTESHPHQPWLVLSRVCTQNSESVEGTWDVFKPLIVLLAFSHSLAHFLRLFLPRSLTCLPKESPTSSSERMKRGNTVRDRLHQTKGNLFFERVQNVLSRGINSCMTRKWDILANERQPVSVSWPVVLDYHVHLWFVK